MKLKRGCLMGLVFLPSLFLAKNVTAQTQCEFLNNLTPYQYKVAYQIYHVGKEWDLGLTSVAIAWKESKLGKYKVRFNRDNIKDVSVGVMHTVAYWKTKDMTAFESGRWIESMIDNDILSISVGIKDLVYWQDRSKQDWFKGVAMYNGGNNPNYGYAKSIANIVKDLKNCSFD